MPNRLFGITLAPLINIHLIIHHAIPILKKQNPTVNTTVRMSDRMDCSTIKLTIIGR